MSKDVLVRCQVLRGAFSQEPVVIVESSAGGLVRMACDLDYVFAEENGKPRPFRVEDYDNKSLEDHHLVRGSRSVVLSETATLVMFWNDECHWVKASSIAYKNVPVEFNWISEVMP